MSSSIFKKTKHCIDRLCSNITKAPTENSKTGFIELVCCTNHQPIIFPPKFNLSDQREIYSERIRVRGLWSTEVP